MSSAKKRFSHNNAWLNSSRTLSATPTTNRLNNANVEEEFLTSFLKRQGHGAGLVTKALRELRKGAVLSGSKTLYDANREVYGLLRYGVIPSVIYTAPEIAWVGQTEAEIKASGIPYKVGAFAFAANGRAKGMEQTAGMVKLICGEEDDELLGVHIVGPMAGELIAEAVLAMEFGASGKDLQRTIHAHPTLTEAIHEAALAADKRAIHAINR